MLNIFQTTRYQRLAPKDRELDADGISTYATRGKKWPGAAIPLLILLTGWILWTLMRLQLTTVARLSGLAKTINGTYAAVYDQRNEQHQFLGMPYALPPLGPLRFRPPAPVNRSWEGVRNSTSYGPVCPVYDDQYAGYPQDEDCLTINVITPKSAGNPTLLPVAVWIYGGAGQGGGARHRMYNLSFIASHAARHGMPFLAVSFNYRSSILGFVAGREAQGTGNLNLGLRDQRLALHWVQENIAAFGGDPRKVTIWGGSSGADDVGLHLTAYGGRDDRLFRAAILQSGSPVVKSNYRHAPAQAAYDRVVAATCAGQEDTLDCLRNLPFEELNNAFDDGSQGKSVDMVALALPAIDGDFVQTYGSISLAESKFVKVPIMIGSTSNEGFHWIPPHLASHGDLERHLRDSYRHIPPPIVDRLLSHYPAANTQEQLDPPIQSVTDADVYRRADAVLGDIEINAGTRLTCKAYSQASSCYSYRWDTPKNFKSGNPEEGSRHGAELEVVFQNFQDSWSQHRQPGYYEMASTVGLMWAGFITSLDPNIGIATKGTRFWPKYSAKHPQNIVFNETELFWVEEDDQRRPGTDYISTILASILDK